MKHTITLNQGSLRVLVDVLNQSGWAKTTSDIIVAGRLLSTLPEPVLPEDVKKETVLEWIAVSIPPFDLEEKDRDVCKKALKHVVEAGTFPTRPHAGLLLQAFGFD